MQQGFEETTISHRMGHSMDGKRKRLQTKTASGVQTALKHTVSGLFSTVEDRGSFGGKMEPDLSV